MTCESVACRSYFTNKSFRDVCALRDLWYLWAMCVRASMKAAKPLHIVLATNPNPTRARGYPLNINPKPDPKPDSISGPAGSGRVADLYLSFLISFFVLCLSYYFKWQTVSNQCTFCIYIFSLLCCKLNVSLNELYPGKTNKNKDYNFCITFFSLFLSPPWLRITYLNWARSGHPWSKW